MAMCCHCSNLVTREEFPVSGNVLIDVNSERSFLQINFNEEYQQSKPDQPDRLHAGVWEGSIAGKL